MRTNELSLCTIKLFQSKTKTNVCQNQLLTRPIFEIFNPRWKWQVHLGSLNKTKFQEKAVKCYNHVATT